MAWGQPAQMAPSYEQQPQQVGLSFLPSGTEVKLTTALHGSITGHVVCFDTSLNILAIKESVANGKTLLRVFNIKFITAIQELAAATPETEAEALQCAQSSGPQVNERKHAAVLRRVNDAMPEEVSYEGQRAFVQLRRTLDLELKWHGPNIHVLDRVIIKAPYGQEDCTATNDDQQSLQALDHVRKVLSKAFVPDAKLEPCCKKQ